MNCSDTASLITSHLSDSELEKLYLLGLLPGLQDISLRCTWWYSRVITLFSHGKFYLISYDPKTDWKQVYIILVRELQKDYPSYCNEEDNLAAAQIIGLQINLCSMDCVWQAAREGLVNILPWLIRGLDSGTHLGCLIQAVECGQDKIVELILGLGKVQKIHCDYALVRAYALTRQ